MSHAVSWAGLGVAGADVLRASQPPALADAAAPSRPRRQSQGLFRCFWRHLAERVNQQWAGDSRAGRHRRAVRCSSLPSRACSPGGRAGFAPVRSPSHSRTRRGGHLAWPPRWGEAMSPAWSFTQAEVRSALPSTFRRACKRLGVVQSSGRAASASTNAAAESFCSTLEHERISRCRYTARHQARLDIATWIDTWYNKKRLHSTNNMTSPTDHEHAPPTINQPSKKRGEAQAGRTS